MLHRLLQNIEKQSSNQAAATNGNKLILLLRNLLSPSLSASIPSFLILASFL